MLCQCAVAPQRDLQFTVFLTPPLSLELAGGRYRGVHDDSIG
jgi:hypothetical protein